MKKFDKNSLILNSVRSNCGNVLDIGCGSGALHKNLNEMGVRVFGVEIDPVKAEVAKKKCAEFVTGSIEDAEVVKSIAARGKKFDLIICSEVLEHLVDPLLVLTRLKPLLASGGKLIAVLPNVAFYKMRLTLLRGNWDYAEEGILDRTHLKFFVFRTAKELFLQAGYRILEVRGTHYSKRFSFIYNFLTTYWPQLFSEQFVIVSSGD